MKIRKISKEPIPKARRGRSRDAVVDAAEQLFLDRGFGAVSMDELASAAGVVRGFGAAAAGGGADAAPVAWACWWAGGAVAGAAGEVTVPGGTAAELGMGNWHCGQNPPCAPGPSREAAAAAGVRIIVVPWVRRNFRPHADCALVSNISG